MLHDQKFLAISKLLNKNGNNKMEKYILFMCACLLSACQTIPSRETKDSINDKGLTGIPKEVRTLSNFSLIQEKLPMCAPLKVEVTLDRYPVVDKVEGFTSRMSGYKPARNSENVEAFANAFSRAATQAYLSNDEEAKRSLITTLGKWASANALLKTESCVSNGNLSGSERCKEWRKPDGSDLAPIKDATFVTFIMAGFNRAYYNLLESSNADMIDEHRVIKRWLGNELKDRLKSPRLVYFGLNAGWYWTAIDQDLNDGNIKSAKERVGYLIRELESLINDDGSIANRTTRGNRALWYHFSSVHEIVMSMEYAHSLGIPINSNLENKLHKAVDLFLKGYADKSYMMKWAEKAHNSTYSGAYQDWDDKNFRFGTSMTSWISAYVYRYPKNSNALMIRKLVPTGSVSSTRDTDYGFGAGCIYDAANLLKDINIVQ